MRKLTRVTIFALFVAIAAPALAEDIEQATLDNVQATATKGYAHPASAKLRNVHKSLATNGSGYCGEVTVEETEETYTTFHVLLDTPNGPSVLRLYDFSSPDTDPQAATVHQMMRNFGCLK